jgi:hypothetical protein
MDAQRYLYGPTQTINVGVVPTLGRGNGLTPAQIAVDYIEVTVSYQQ